MARRSEHSLEEIKLMVLKAAESIVLEEGFAALTMRKIAMEIGYTVGSIYMVFANMSDLVLHLNARTLDDIAVEFENTPECRPDRCLEEMGKIYLRFASRNFNRWSMIFEHRLPKDCIVPEWYQSKIEHVFYRFEAQFVKLAPDCSDIEKKRVARALWGAIHGISILSLTGKLDIVGLQDIEESVVMLVRHFIRGWMLNNNAVA